MTERHELSFTLNGEAMTATVEARLNLADFLRHTLHLTGTHFPQIYRPGVDYTETGPAQITLASGVQAPNADDTLILQYVKA